MNIEKRVGRLVATGLLLASGCAPKAGAVEPADKPVAPDKKIETQLPTAIPPSVEALATATKTPEPGPTPPPTSTPESTSTPEPKLDPAKCVFIKDPEICALGQPRTREGMEDQITGIFYNNIPPGTPIHTRIEKGYFSPRWDNTTKEIVGVSIRFEDGSNVSITGDLRIDNKRVREVEKGEIVAKVGQSGEVIFSTGAKEDPITGKYNTPQSFFTDNFPEVVLKKPKIVRPAVSGTPSSVTVTKVFQ